MGLNQRLLGQLWIAFILVSIFILIPMHLANFPVIFANLMQDGCSYYFLILGLLDLAPQIPLGAKLCLFAPPWWTRPYHTEVWSTILTWTATAHFRSVLPIPWPLNLNVTFFSPNPLDKPKSMTLILGDTCSCLARLVVTETFRLYATVNITYEVEIAFCVLTRGPSI